MRRKALVSWSGGKDSARALYDVQRAGDYEVVALLTTFACEYERVSHHGVREALMNAQAAMVGIPLQKVYVPAVCSHDEYELIMGSAMREARVQGVEAVIFGDIFLEDLRKHRESKLKLVDMEAVFPIWKRPTELLAQEFLELGFRSAIASADSRIFTKREMLKDYDAAFIKGLRGRSDPCGENGEFHTFAYDGPIFSRQVTFSRRDIELRDNHFYYCDLVSE